MPATALIRFTQGANTDVAGKAVLGDYEDFSAITVTNGDNTDVVEWTIYLLDAPPDSVSFPMGSNPQVLATAVTATPTTNFTPDADGTWRIMLEVRDALGAVDRDIRCFGIPDARGFVRPPYQKGPDPLPVELPIIISELPRPIKPDEQNYGLNERGWAGDRVSGQLEQFFEEYADNPFQLVSSTPFSATVGQPPLYVVDLPTIGGAATLNLPLTPRTGYTVQIFAIGPRAAAQRLTVAPSGGGNIGSFTSLILLGDSSIKLIHRGSNQWAIIGGKHEIIERTIVGGSQNTDTTGWTVVGTMELNLSDFLNTGSTIVWRAIAQTTNVLDPAQMRLFNVTTAAEVVGSVLNFGAVTPALQQATVSLPAGSNLYEAQLRLTVTGSPNRAICYQAQAVVDDFQA